MRTIFGGICVVVAAALSILAMFGAIHLSPETYLLLLVLAELDEVVFYLKQLNSKDINAK